MILVFWQECKNDLEMALQSTFWRLQQSLQNRMPRVQVLLPMPFGPVVQLVRTLACHARGRRFEPDPGRQFCWYSSGGRAHPW